MRRKAPDFSYKEITSEIVQKRFQPWQLTRKDTREGFHRLINRTVSIMRELDNEGLYIENMFFPEQMDLSEEWVLYRPYPNHPMDELYLSGQPIVDVITPVGNIDHMLAGGIDILDFQFALSGLPYGNSILSLDLQHTYLLGSGILTEIDLMKNMILGSGQIDTSIIAEHTFYADSNHTLFPIREAYREGTISVTRSGMVIPCEIKERSELTGVWNEDFDPDNNGIIGSYERAAIESSLGISQQDIPAAEWQQYDWMDTNRDGIISESDYTVIMGAYPSAAPDVEAVIEVPYGNAGAFFVRYEKKFPQSQHIVRRAHHYSILDDFHKLYAFAAKVTYDPHTDVYYGINHNGTQLRAYKYDSIHDEVVSDLLIHVPTWSHACSMIDIDLVDGILYLLITDGVNSTLFYGDVWTETVEEMSSEALIPSLSGIVPDAFSAMPDGYFAILTGNTIAIYKGSRDRIIEIDGITYFNRRHTVTQKDMTALKTIPHYIFNNWDSYAYSYGITRPLGCDNLQMKKLLMDFFEHPQGNDKIGMQYGMFRELGYVNCDVIPSGLSYAIPSPLTYSGETPYTSWDVWTNGCPMTVHELSGAMGEYLLLSGEIGTIRIENGIRLFPDEIISKTYDMLSIEGYYRDHNNDPVRLTYSIPIRTGTIDPVITARSYADVSFLQEIAYVHADGTPSDMLKAFAQNAEDTDPFIYANAKTDMTPMDSQRISEEPILATIYDPNISGLLTGMTEVEIEL